MDELELADIQGLLRHGYPFQHATAYCLFHIEDPVGTGTWLNTLVNPGEPWIDGAHMEASRLRMDDCSVAIAFTASGLQGLGLNGVELQTFVAEFQEGMAVPHRSRLLGDVGPSDPSTWDWNRSPSRADEPALHGVLMVFARARQLAGRLDEIQQIHGCPRLFRTVIGSYEPNRCRVAAEPFGFADGLSQPFISGLTRKASPPGVRHLRAGEFVLGYPNQSGRFPASPCVSRDPHGILRPQGTSGLGDFGRNGSYLVMRQLEQNVNAFETCLVNFAASLAAGRNPTARELADLREWIGAKMVGRWKSGAPLSLHPEEDMPGMMQSELEAQNGFGYHHEDRHGLRCPIGAHIRRANPRDSLADSLGIGHERAQALVDEHRILRRGRVYEESGRRGLMFLCLNANIERQFEFVQGSWLMHPEFGGLSGEVDPILGNAGGEHNFTIQRTVLGERRVGLAQFVTVKGGAYFFLPGLRALRYLAWRAQV
jgi:Dyp-type peroxidase family